MVPFKICLLLVGNSLKTYICSSRESDSNASPVQIHIPILNRVAKSIEDILRYHKISFDTLNTLVTRKYRFSKNSF